MPPSNLSLIGIARHLTDVELNYFRRRWGGQEIASYYASEDRPDAGFEDASPATAERDLQRLVAAQEAARQAVAGMALEEIFVNPRWGQMSLRWALIHMIGEYAGHTGQADQPKPAVNVLPCGQLPWRARRRRARKCGKPRSLPWCTRPACHGPHAGRPAD